MNLDEISSVRSEMFIVKTMEIKSSSVRSDMFSIHYIPLLTELEYSSFS
jgi:hypothetical protein